MKEIIGGILLTFLISCLQKQTEVPKFNSVTKDNFSQPFQSEFKGYLGTGELCGTLIRQKLLIKLDTQQTVKIQYELGFDEYKEIIERMPHEFEEIKIERIKYDRYLKEIKGKKIDKKLIYFRMSLGLTGNQENDILPFNYWIEINKKGMIELDLTVLVSDKEKLKNYFE